MSRFSQMYDDLEMYKAVNGQTMSRGPRAAGMSGAPGGGFTRGFTRDTAGTSSNLLDMLQQMQTQFQQSAGQREKDMLAMADKSDAAANQREQQQLSLADQYGGAAKRSGVRAINRGARAETAGAQANLNSRGLGNSTIVNSVTHGIERDRQIALSENAGRINDERARVKMNVLANHPDNTAMRMNVIGQRPLDNPMQGIYANLLMQRPAEEITQTLLPVAGKTKFDPRRYMMA